MQALGAKLAVAAGVPESDVLIDEGRRHALVRARALPGAGLATYRALETRIAASEPDWQIELVPPAKQFDVASLLAAWLLKLLQYAVLMGVVGLGSWSLLPVLALLGVAKLAASVATAVIIVAAVMSWMQNRTPVSDVFERLAAPLLAPVRKLVPLVGGIDLSPLLVIVALQVIGIVLGSLQASLWGAGAAVLAG